MLLNYGQSDGIINDHFLNHMDILLEVKYLNFDFFLINVMTAKNLLLRNKFQLIMYRI